MQYVRKLTLCKETNIRNTCFEKQVTKFEKQVWVEGV